MNRNCELIFDYNNESFGPAFTIDKKLVDEGFYLILSFVNTGKMRIISLN